MTDPKLERLRRERAGVRKRRRGLIRRIAEQKAKIGRLTKRIARRKAMTKGERAVAYAARFVGKTEQPAGSNDAPFLREWRENLQPRTLDWMRGQPWCGFFCIAAYYYGAGVRLPDGVVFTPNIVSWARQGTHFKAVPATEARPGDLVVFNFPGGSSVADHVALARGPARNGVIPTREGNTSPSSAGSQANGGGCFDRSRPVGQIAVVARPI